MTDRIISYLPLAELKPDPRNPKSHDVDLLDASLDRFGVVDLITLDARTGYIISGHGRTRALREREERGEEAPEGIQIDPETGAWLIPVNTGWASRNDAEAAAALISMNRTTEAGGWSDESLLTLLDELSATGAGFEGVGFSATDYDDLKHLLEDVPDLDSLADEWDPENSPSASTGGKAVTIKLTDAGAIEKWHEVRDTVKNDDEAALVLFGLVSDADAASTALAATKTRARRAARTKDVDAELVAEHVDPETVEIMTGKLVSGSISANGLGTIESIEGAPEDEDAEIVLDLSAIDEPTDLDGDEL